jgi:hypothetical protein
MNVEIDNYVAQVTDQNVDIVDGWFLQIGGIW